MARPLWSDAGVDPAAIADHLDHLAQTATVLRFEPRPLPHGIDPAILHQAALIRARRQLTQRHGERDRILAQEVRAIDDLVRSSNLMVERLREWYALHAPEATRLVKEASDLARLVAQHGDRAAVMKALDQAQDVGSSLGTELDAADLAPLQAFAAALQAMHAAWGHLETRVGELMGEIAPNVASVVGPIVGARLIALAGSLQKLAIVPAGTVQLYGAETALFRHIKEGTKPPKHGVLFQHPLVHLAPPWQRGAIARALAQHVSLAAKADAFTGNDLQAQLKVDLEADLARIRADRPRPPRRVVGREHSRAPPGKPGSAQRSKPWAGGGKPRSGPAGPGSRAGSGSKPRGPGDGGGGYGGTPGQGGDRGGFGGRPANSGASRGKPGQGRRDEPRSSGGKGQDGSGGFGGKPGSKKRDRFKGGPAKPPGGGR